MLHFRGSSQVVSNPCECRSVLHHELDVSGNLSADYGQLGWKMVFDCSVEKKLLCEHNSVFFG